MSKNDLKEERMKILDLLTKGLITADDAEKLLAAIGDSKEEPEVLLESKKKQFRMLKIYVDSADGDQVRVQLPIEFAKLLKSKKFNIDGLDDIDIDVDTIINMVNSGAMGELVNVQTADGDDIKITVE